jgi:5'-3' exonuclease
MIIVDYSGIAISNIFTQKDALSENLVRHMILNSLRMYNVKFRGKYGQMVLACDGGNTWRRNLFPQYKASRKKNREEGGLDWPEFFRILTMVREEIKQNLPFKVLHLDTIEADDIIATLVERTQKFGKNEPVMIVSADKDFIQLQQYSNVAQFSPMTKSFVKEKDPIRYLQEHIIRGDSGDGVPNILSGDNVFVNGERQTPISSKKVEAWIQSWSDLTKVMDEQTLRNLQRNRALIDLSNIPESKKSLIINSFEIAKTNSNVLNYLVTKRCSNLIECAAEFTSP